MSLAPDQEVRFRARFPEYTRSLDCVHCGLCIPYCPTHGITGREADSPRGRIYLMRGYAEGEFDLSPEAEKHLDQCIVCRACETVCPSGIRMGEMMESFRGARNASPGRKGLGYYTGRFLLRHVLPHRERIAALTDLLYFYQASGLRRIAGAILGKLSARMAELDPLQPQVPPPSARRIETDRARPEGYPAEGKARIRAGLFLGCIGAEWFAPTHRATILALRKNGCDVIVPDAQTCCGALHRHAGFLDDAEVLYGKNAEAFSRAKVDVILVNAAGCGAALKEPPHSMPRGLGAPVRDICEFLDEIGIAPPERPLRKKVAYHQPCHLVHGQGVGPAAVEGVLRAIPGLELVPLVDSDRCCGSGGIYNLLHPEIALPLLEEKVKAIVESGAEVVATGNPGCAMQIRSGLAGKGIEVAHPIDLLGAAYGEA